MKLVKPFLIILLFIFLILTSCVRTISIHNDSSHEIVVYAQRDNAIKIESMKFGVLAIQPSTSTLHAVYVGDCLHGLCSDWINPIPEDRNDFYFPKDFD